MVSEIQYHDRRDITSCYDSSLKKIWCVSKEIVSVKFFDGKGDKKVKKLQEIKKLMNRAA
jgi:hypothetical protein